VLPLENSHVGSDGRVYAEFVLTFRRVADERNGVRAAAASFERTEFLQFAQDARACSSKNAGARAISHGASVYAQSERR